MEIPIAEAITRARLAGEDGLADALEKAQGIGADHVDVRKSKDDPTGVEVRALRFVSLAKAAQVDDELRFTLAPMYIPDTVDAHGDFVTAPELQISTWAYVRSGHRWIYLQHDDYIVAGDWVEIYSLPTAWTTKITRPDGTEESVTFPVGTIMLGVVWEKWAWEMVKTGAITGYSIGAYARTGVSATETPSASA